MQVELDDPALPLVLEQLHMLNTKIEQLIDKQDATHAEVVSLKASLREKSGGSSGSWVDGGEIVTSDGPAFYE